MVNISDTRELGNLLGTSLKSANDYKADFVESEYNADITLASLATVRVTGSWYIYKKLLGDESFVIDHPVYGELDSSILEIDGGYGDVDPLPSYFPLSFPILLGSSTLVASVLFSSGTL